MNAHKKGLVSHFLIVLLLGIIVLGLYLWITGGTYKDLYENPQTMSEEVEKAYLSLIDKETKEEETLRTKQEKTFLDFSKQITTILDTCLQATNAPCLCELKQPKIFTQRYQLKLKQHEENSYSSFTEELKENQDPFILTNPKIHSNKQPFKLCTYTNKEEETKEISFTIEEKQLKIQTEQGSYLLGKKNLQFYKTTGNNFCFLPEGIRTPPLPTLPSCTKKTT